MSATQVIAWDGSASAHAAVLWALERAHRRPGELRLVTVIDDALALGHSVRIAAEQALAAEVAWAQQQSSDCTVTSVLRTGDPEREIVGQCPPGSLLIVGTPQQNAPYHRRSLAARLVRMSAVPVAVIPRSVRTDNSGILVGVDDSPPALAAALLAADEAHSRGEILYVVHAWPSPEKGGRDEDELTDEREIQERILQRVLSRIRAAYPDVDVTGHLEPGRPTAVLLRQAVIRSVKLLVVGSRGQGAIQGFFLGSVSHGLVLTCDCPVLVVKGEG